jgi:hypothetical protein
MFFFLSVSQQLKSGLGRIIVEVYISHTPGRTFPIEWSARRRGHYLSKNIRIIREEQPCFQRDSNPQPQQASGRRRRGNRDRLEGSS